MGDTSRLLANQGRECVSSATSLNILDGIAIRDRDPRALGHHSPSHQWDTHRSSMFLFTPTRAREIGISPRVLHKHLLFHRWATWARVRVEVKDKDHRLGRQGSRGISMQLYHRLSQRTSPLYRVCFCYLSCGQGYCLILVHHIHSSLHHV